MEELIFIGAVIALVFSIVKYSDNRNVEHIEEKIIQEKGFCLDSTVSGVEFKKCFDLVERK